MKLLESGIRTFVKLSLIAPVAAVMLSGQVWAADEMVLKTQKDKISYIVGIDMGKGMKQQALDVDPDLVAKGMKDVFAGNKTMLAEEEMTQIRAAYKKESMEKQQVRMKEASARNKKEGEAFLAENMKKEGVKTLPSGLQYKIIKEGTGAMPKLTDMVTTNYRGTLINNTEFDSSYKRGQPGKFPVNGVIAGWTEALQLMKAGSKWQLFIPPNLAYGERGAGGVIEPNATLIFDLELISIN